MSDESLVGPALAESLGLESFVEPDDQGLPLDELSQAYAALLARGADPYADQTGEEVAGASGEVSRFGPARQ